MLARGAKLPRSNVEEQMPMLAGWVQSHLRAETESRYWLDGQARAAPDIAVLGEAWRAALYRTGLLRHQVGRNQAACFDCISSRRA
ncbi:hypothetical protein NVS55_10825 [Myxococcus stipitatus]|uniref:hypothetical protein n=1 Tax=Myxococcus stipitatus TaxID=83455 RepID=UPI00314566F3